MVARLRPAIARWLWPLIHPPSMIFPSSSAASLTCENDAATVHEQPLVTASGGSGLGSGRMTPGAGAPEAVRRIICPRSDTAIHLCRLESRMS